MDSNGHLPPSPASRDEIHIEYIPLQQFVFWDRNPKQHDIGALVQSIQRYGFRDAAIYDATLKAIVAGNGRGEALQWMLRQKMPPPRGVRVQNGEWYVPVQMGVDARTAQEAESFGVDHNNLTMLGGDFTALEISKMWNDVKYLELLGELSTTNLLPVSVGAEELRVLQDAFEDPDPNEPDDADDDFVSRAEEFQQKWRVAPGDIWEIPSQIVRGQSQFLFCGDAFSEEVERKIDESFRLEFSDPPYEINMNGSGIVEKSKYSKDMIAAGVTRFDPARLRLIAKTSVFCCNRPLVPQYIALAQQSDVQWDIALYLRENGIPNYAGHLMTDAEYLMVLGGQSPQPGLSPKTLYSRWWIGAGENDRIVQWQKPFGLVSKFIQVFSERGDRVLDRFSGAGTTLVVCESLGRVGRAVELNPEMCAATLERFVKMNREPRKAGHV